MDGHAHMSQTSCCVSFYSNAQHSGKVFFFFFIGCVLIVVNSTQLTQFCKPLLCNILYLLGCQVLSGSCSQYFYDPYILHFKCHQVYVLIISHLYYSSDFEYVLLNGNWFSSAPSVHCSHCKIFTINIRSGDFPALTCSSLPSVIEKCKSPTIASLWHHSPF